MSKNMSLQAGGSRLWLAAHHVRNWSLTLALGVTLLVGGLLGHSSLATAQPAGPGQDPAFFPSTGYRIASPAVLDYFLRRGGVRTFGPPVSSEFPLLGKRVQIFQRQMLELDADGSVHTATILDPDILPISHIDGLTLPGVDPELTAAAPLPGSDDYTTQALTLVNVYVPDQWNGLPVNFQSTYLNSVTCADAFGSDPCDPSLLPALALEVWGLPTSLPMLDPLNAEFVYQRFQKGIMHFSHATGLTQGLLVGDWLKRVIVGTDLSADMGADVRSSRFYAQYAPSRPLALDRPNDLPDTSLAQAFRADSLNAAVQAQQAEPTLPANVAQTATAVALTATAISGTQIAVQGTQTVVQGTQAVLQGTQTVLQGTQTVETATSLSATAVAAVAAQTPTPSPGSVVSSIPVVNLGCLGDEQMWFTPRRPNTGTHVDISVTSQRHHDARTIRLTGPLDPGPVTERVGPLGFVWTWTVVPVIEDFHVWTFYADGLRPCMSSGFNAYQPLGATATATATAKPSDTPGNTATPTPTIVPVPVLNDVTPKSLTCNSTVQLHGNNFGSPPSEFGTTALLVSGASSQLTTLQQVGTGSNTLMFFQLPSSGLTAGPGQIQVNNANNSSAFFAVTITDCSAVTSPTNTPTLVVPAPALTSLSTTALTCNTRVTLTGSNFGNPPSSLNTQVILLSNGPQLNLTPIGTGSSTSITVQLPSTGLVASPLGTATLQVSNSGGDSRTVPVSVAAC